MLRNSNKYRRPGTAHWRPWCRDIPSAWGSTPRDVDLFRDENIAFMQKLIADGSPGELDVYPGVYHAAENLYPDAEVSKRKYAETLGKLKKGLLIG